MSSRLTREIPLKLARGVYRRARQGLSGLGQLEALPGNLTKLSPYVKQLRHMAHQVLERSPQEPPSFTLAPAEQVGAQQPSTRPIILPDYSDLRAAPASSPSTPR